MTETQRYRSSVYGAAGARETFVVVAALVGGLVAAAGVVGGSVTPAALVLAAVLVGAAQQALP